MKKYSLINDAVFEKFKERKGSSLINNMSNSCTIEQALSVGALLMPQIVEDNGCYFIEEFYNGDYANLEKQYAGDKREIERFVNTWSIPDLFYLNQEYDANNEGVLEAFGELLKKCWEMRFQKVADIKFTVDIGIGLLGENGLSISAHRE